MLERLKRFYKIQGLSSNPGWSWYSARTPIRLLHFYVRSSGHLLYYVTLATESEVFPYESSVTEVLSIAERMQLAPGLVSIEEGQRIPGTAFDSVCALRSPAHESLRFELGADAKNVVQFFPIHRCEMRGDEADASELLERWRHSKILVKWDRTPEPVIEWWYRNAAKGMSNWGEKRGWSSSFREMGALLEGMFEGGDKEALARVRNYRSEDVTVSTDGMGRIRIPGRLETQSHAELMSFLWEFLTDQSANRAQRH